MCNILHPAVLVKILQIDLLNVYRLSLEVLLHILYCVSFLREKKVPRLLKLKARNHVCLQVVLCRGTVSTHGYCEKSFWSTLETSKLEINCLIQLHLKIIWNELRATSANHWHNNADLNKGFDRNATWGSYSWQIISDCHKSARLHKEDCTWCFLRTGSQSQIAKNSTTTCLQLYCTWLCHCTSFVARWFSMK